MHALVLYAHPEPTSFTAALKDTAVGALTRAGHTVEVSDLYGEGFDAVGDRRDFTTVADPDRFHYQSEQEHAHRCGAFAAEIAREQARLARAELVVPVFPVWWGGMPAILKGWFDRVLAYGFAYVDGHRFDSGFFRGKFCQFGAVTGGTSRRFAPDGTYGSIEQVLWPITRCMGEYLGMEVLPPFVAYAAPRIEEHERASYLREWGDLLVETARRTEPARIPRMLVDRNDASLPGQAARTLIAEDRSR
ncbi:NAD(P)H-dependent oxidoreductase [Pseudonocardia kujensis]|uniref:NAD(P)H-dependent oxidoreductase n=1 Tax=Pseudonocardia kujensis TaxID=1128675 RepID=UPI001E28EB5D|nr:NAD(P)H-dependent oxidoreductase [Pseudonocardia kujensis]MCE0762356.1 NAD(P)H-dependent oxidoreductase [Pseudonocardia kujensis]